jgi:hypothetical protein
MAERRVYVEIKCRVCGHVKKRWFKPGHRIPAESNDWCMECKSDRPFDLVAGPEKVGTGAQDAEKQSR